MTKIPNNSTVQRFYAFFPNFRRTLWIGTLKRVNKEKMCCPVGFFEEFTAVFFVKMSRIDAENYKKPKIFQFAMFLCFFVYVSTDFVDWDVLKGQQGKSGVSNSLY